MSSEERAESAEGTQHTYDVGEVLEKADGSQWEITNRMVDVDTDEVLYRLREADVDNFVETEILTESQADRCLQRNHDVEVLES